MFEQIFKRPFNKVLLKGIIEGHKGQMELDGYNDELKLGFEYNGPFHYEPIFGQEQLEKQQTSDELKKRLMEENKILLLIIPHFFDGSKNHTNYDLLQDHIVKEYNLRKAPNEPKIGNFPKFNYKYRHLKKPISLKNFKDLTEF